MKNTIKFGTKIAAVTLVILMVGLSVLAIFQYKNGQHKIAEMENLLSDMSATVGNLDSETNTYKDYAATAQTKAAYYDQISDFLLKKEKTADRENYYTYEKSDWEVFILDRTENNTAKFLVLPDYNGPSFSDSSIVSLEIIRNVYGSSIYSITAQQAGSTLISFESNRGGLYEVLVIVL